MSGSTNLGMVLGATCCADMRKAPHYPVGEWGAFVRAAHDEGVRARQGAVQPEHQPSTLREVGAGVVVLLDVWARCGVSGNVGGRFDAERFDGSPTGVALVQRGSKRGQLGDILG